MPKRQLKPPLDHLESDVIDTLLGGLAEWRPDLDYPESYADMQGCVRAMLRMFTVERRPVAAELEYYCELCGNRGILTTLVDGQRHHLKETTCPDCRPDEFRANQLEAAAAAKGWRDG